MTMSIKLKSYLEERLVDYDLIHHQHTDSSYSSAKAAHIPVERMVKGVLLEDERGYVMAAIPSTREVNLREINRTTGRRLRLVKEEDLPRIFIDCELGAIPALGEAFGFQTLWEETLAFEPEFYVEAGDHEELVHLKHYDFMELMPDINRLRITH